MAKKANKSSAKSVTLASKPQAKKVAKRSLHAASLHQTRESTKPPVKRNWRARLYLKRLLMIVTLVASIVGASLWAQAYQATNKVNSPAPHVDYSMNNRRHQSKVSNKPVITTSPTLTPLRQCEAGKLDIIVAHEDDDLLFMNLDVANAITAGKCVRAVYMTAGDDGHTSDYWLERENGIESAYAFMAGTDNIWTDETIDIHGHTLSVRHLTAHPSISLMFVRLPDGNAKGQGFARTGNVSLEDLASKKINRLSALSGVSSYSYEELMALLASVFIIDQPDDIFTHVTSGSLSVGDHSDHRQVGRLTLNIRNIVRPEARITTYVGYPSGNMGTNLPDDQASQKRQIFLMYAQEDSSICTAAPVCPNESTYANYYSRLYKSNN